VARRPPASPPFHAICPDLEAHTIDWDTFLPRFTLFKAQEQQARARRGV